jgi:hypothetical protein
VANQLKSFVHYLALFFLQIAACYIGTLEVVPAYQVAKAGLVSLLHLAALLFFGDLARSIIKNLKRHKRSVKLLRLSALAALPGMLCINGLATLLLFADDQGRGFLASRELKEVICYPEFGKTLYVYELSNTPDGFQAVEIKAQKGQSPFAQTIGKVSLQTAPQMRQGDIIQFHSATFYHLRSEEQMLLTYSLRSGAVWLNPLAQIKD